jgi:hypothetical protein
MAAQLVILFAMLLPPTAARVALAADPAPPPLTWPAAQVRLTAAQQLARHRGEPALVAKVKELGLRAKDLLAAGKATDAERAVSEAETAVGLDAGGRSMGGVPIYHPTPEMAADVARLRAALDQATRAKDRPAVAAVTADLRRALADQAGLPDAVTPGRRVEVRPPSRRAAVDLFLAALDEDRAQFGQIAAGRPLPDQMARHYAEIVTACCDLRDALRKHRPEQVAKIDSLVAGACFILSALQQKEGHLPFPEARAAGAKAGPTRWVVSVAEDGGSQFDTAEAGVALLTAGRVYANGEWLAAGLRAADWAAAQPCVRNATYTALSVHLLAEAFRATKNRKYADAAVEKWEIGLAPGQLDTGRWVDPHVAKTTHHLLILRGVATLAAVLPDDHADARDAARKAAALAARSVVDEFNARGVTNTAYALQALLAQQALDPGCDPRLATAIEQTAAVVVACNTRDGRPKLGTTVPALAALARAAAE